MRIHRSAPLSLCLRCTLPLAVLAALALAVGITSLGLPAHAAFPGRNGKTAFQSERDGNSEIYAMNANGSGQTNLTSSAGIDAMPDWQPLAPGAVGGIAEYPQLEPGAAFGGRSSAALTAFALPALAVAGLHSVSLPGLVGFGLVRSLRRFGEEE